MTSILYSISNWISMVSSKVSTGQNKENLPLNPTTNLVQNLAQKLLNNGQTDRQSAIAKAESLISKVRDHCTAPQEIIDKALTLHKIASSLLSLSGTTYEMSLQQASLLVSKVSPYCKSEQEIIQEAILVNSLANQLTKNGIDYYKALDRVAPLRNKVLSIPISDKDKQTIFNRAFLLLPYREAQAAFEIASSNAPFLHLSKISHDQPALEIYNDEKQGWHAYRIHIKRLGEGGAGTAKTCLDVASQKELCRLSSLGKTKSDIVLTLSGYRGIVKIYHTSEYEGKNRKNENDSSVPRDIVPKEAFIEEKMDGDCHAIYAKANLSAEQKREISLDLLHGLKAMHDHGVMHNDLKPSNMLFKIDPNTQKASACIADFDRSQFLSEAKLHGTPFYWAPEATMLHLKKLSAIDFEAKDVYEFSHVLLEIYADELQTSPVRHITEISAKRVTSTRPYPITSPTKSEYDACKPLPNDPPIAHFIYKCMSFNPEERPSANEMLQEFEEMIAQGKV